PERRAGDGDRPARLDGVDSGRSGRRSGNGRQPRLSSRPGLRSARSEIAGAGRRDRAGRGIVPRTAPTVLPILESGSPACARFLDRLLARRGAGASAIDAAVAAIIAEVRRDGDAALVRLTARFDGVTIPRT